MFIHWEQLQCKYLLCFNVAVVHGSPSQGLLVQTEIRVCSKANDAYVLMVECSARVVQGIQWCLCKNYRSDLFYITDVDLTAQARFSGMRRNLAIPRVSHIYRVSLSSELIGNESGGGEEPLVTEIIVKTTYLDVLVRLFGVVAEGQTSLFAGVSHCLVATAQSWPLPVSDVCKNTHLLQLHTGSGGWVTVMLVHIWFFLSLNAQEM